MGSACCMRLQTKKDIARSNETNMAKINTVRTFYKQKKTLMHQKIRTLLKHISKFGKVQYDCINLNFVSFQKHKIQYLAMMLPFFTDIKILKLWKCKIGHSGMKLIASALGDLAVLEQLSLEDNELGTEGCISLSASLAKLSNLKELWLHINDIGANGAFYLSEAIRELRFLERLGLDENSIGNDGIMHIVKALLKTKAIKMLGIGQNQISGDVCVDTAMMISSIPIEKIVMSGNDLDEKTISEIMEILPRALIL